MTKEKTLRADGSPLDGPRYPSVLAFQRAMIVGPCHVITPSGGYGAFDLRPRRLVELGYAKGLRRSKRNQREIWKCDFIGSWTERKLLGSPLGQVTAFHASLRGYLADFERGNLALPEGCSLAGALAVLHVGGRGALKSFENLFSDTRKRYDAVKEMTFEVDRPCCAQMGPPSADLLPHLCSHAFELAALAFLADECKSGNERAAEEWKTLGRQSAYRKKMGDAVSAARSL